MAETTAAHPIFLSSTTAHLIHELGEVEKEITRLLQLAASSVALLTVPELDPPDESNSASKAATQPSSGQSTPPPGSPEIVIGQRIRLPQGDERAERFVAEVTEYYQKLDFIQHTLRVFMARLRKARIAPTSVKAPPLGFVPPSFGVGPEAGMNAQGLQETRVERDAWRDVTDALERLRADLRARKANTEVDPDVSMNG